MTGGERSNQAQKKHSQSESVSESAKRCTAGALRKSALKQNIAGGKLPAANWFVSKNSTHKSGLREKSLRCMECNAT